MTNEITINNAFEIGKIYQAFTSGEGFTNFKVIARSAKFVTVQNLTTGKETRCKVDLDSEKYYIFSVGRYFTDEVIRPIKDKKTHALKANAIVRTK